MSDLKCLVGGERTAHKRQLGSFSIPQPCCWSGVVGERGAHNQAIHPSLSHFAKAKEKEGRRERGKSTDPVLMKSTGSKLYTPAPLTRIYQLYPPKFFSFL